ncbi:hypothetical protein GC173_08160 [bacterium]|nr:hypothetical protein [bacterium]
MAEQITFRGSVLWDDATNGAGWDFRPGMVTEEATEAKAPLGVGFWVKPAGSTPATHTLELAWRTTDKSALALSIRSLATVSLGALVVPGWGSFGNCRLSAVSEFESFKSDAATGYIVRATLTFTEYP